jgi:PAS domain S-box-containing protein
LKIATCIPPSVSLCSSIRWRAKLKASERWLAAVLRGIGDAVMTVDAEGLVRSMNPQAEVLTGWRQQDAIGQSIDRVLSLDDEPPAEALSPHPGDGERVLCTQHGQRLPIEMTASAIVDEREGDVGTVIIFRNISQRKAMERALIQQAEELSRSNEELQRFAYVVSHDLRSPLNVVGMSLSALQHTYAERLDERGRRFIERGNQSVRRMGQLIDDLLSYARVQSQAAPLEPIAAGEVLQTAVENLEAAITENSAQISHDPLPQVLADRTQLLQLLQNLLSNAITYRREEPPHIHIAAQSADEGWLFRVQDNGVGIAGEEHERIFEMFHRVASQKHRPGTGIGLATCKRIVERHGGRIWVKSQLGQGSTFFFTLPRAPATPAKDNGA